MSRRRKRNLVNWERQAYWFEAEGTRIEPPPIRPRFYSLTTISQDIARKEIVEKLCEELTKAGFKTYPHYAHPRTYRCALPRLEEQKCFIERTKPYYLSQEAKEWAERYLKALETRARKRRRKPFYCPP